MYFFPSTSRWALPSRRTLTLALGLWGLTSVLAPALQADEFQEPITSGRCHLTVEVMAVVYNYKRPDRSFAMVVSGRDPGRVVGVGSSVAGLVVLAVNPERLWLNAEPAPCYVPLAHEDDRVIKKRKKRKKKRRRRRRRKKR